MVGQLGSWSPAPPELQGRGLNTPDTGSCRKYVDSGMVICMGYYSIGQIVNFINYAGLVLTHHLHRSAVLRERILKYTDPLLCPRH